MEKRILRPDRLRTLPPQWSWVDQRLLRMNGPGIKNPGAWAMYLFLITVSDRNGISYYSDKTMEECLWLSHEELALARADLIRADLLAYQGAIYQLLSLPCEKEALETQRSIPPGMMSVRSILQTIAGGVK